ncbi:glycosyltransferase [uncultured Roseobacter sp.]|uniref:glycosyltransferase family protein n=1 Tax=uncultured Roseobacter sp. TaxID=114847 RepID=UPI0026318788|nr:glycosyltransferase [uncultured Roseobacter sp.]
MRVAILVTHLLGSGHLARALTLGRAVDAAGHKAVVLSGGMPAPQLATSGVQFVQLPPLRSDGVAFTRLLDADGGEASAALLDARATAIRAALVASPVDVLITELFPFGRRVLRAEFLSAIEAARSQTPAPLICASIRDILAPPSKPARAETTQDIITRLYDAVLVHADPDVTPLEASWPVTGALAAKLHYTGFVAPLPPGPHPDGIGSGEILVSAGGGDVGGALFEAALSAAVATPAWRWRVLVGGGADARVATLADAAPSNLKVEPARPDFRQMLQGSAASVSMAGYNTALDLLQTGTPAVLIPFDAGGETEQSLRAAALSKLPGVEVLRTAELTGERLRDAVAKVQAAPPRAPRADGMEGAARTVEILQELLEARRAD